MFNIDDKVYISQESVDCVNGTWLLSVSRRCHQQIKCLDYYKLLRHTHTYICMRVCKRRVFVYRNSLQKFLYHFKLKSINDLKLSIVYFKPLHIDQLPTTSFHRHIANLFLIFCDTRLKILLIKSMRSSGQP